MVQHRSNEASQRLETIPGIGVIGATAIAATVPDPKVFGSGRDFAAWIGLVPREVSTGGKRSSGRSRNGAIAICDAFWWSEPARYCDTAGRRLSRHGCPFDASLASFSPSLIPVQLRVDAHLQRVFGVTVLGTDARRR